ncbi:MAG: efflux RND transporter permease subunit, partial [Flavobacteriaceae bacterium]|nr:efflux RND transporter permease subunit [Flavobacteriaceae bacterium]
IFNILKIVKFLPFGKMPNATITISAITIVILLSVYWRPLGVDFNIFSNLIFVSVIAFGLLGVFTLFQNYYVRILTWALANKMLFLSIPIVIVFFGISIWKNRGKEFMPSLNEGSFLLMPTSMPHAGVAENKRILKQLDMAVASIPEIKTVVGKAGRVESALDPAPLSMYENMIQYKTEYMLNSKGKRQRYKVNSDKMFVLKDGSLIPNSNVNYDENVTLSLSKSFEVTNAQLIPDNDGEFFRQWRKHIKNPNDIWKEIIKVTKLPGVTSAPKLQPIETRLVMLQTGMRAPMGIKVKGQDLKQIEAFGIQLEAILKQAKGVKVEAVFADRIVVKPYLLIDIDREKIARYGISIENVQSVLKIAVGGMEITQTVEGRERYGVRVRYPRELRTSPSDLENILVPIKNGNP